jgi:hypothetical protein
MKAKFLSFCLLLLCAPSVFGDAQMVLKNVSIYSSAGEKTYYVPIWVDLNENGTIDPGEGLGNYADALGRTATLALYLQDDPTPLATALFRKDTYGQFLGVPTSQTVSIPGYVGGQRAPLTIKVWVGESFETAFVRGSWNFVSAPLGGLVPDGPPLVPPSVEGWGDPDGSGFALTPPPRPLAGPDTVTRRSFSEARMAIADLLANDGDPAGGSISFARVDSISALGASVTIVNSEIVYHGSATAGNDSFGYSIHNSVGGVAVGRVNIVTSDPEGMILFRNFNIPTPAPDAFYNAPIFVDGNLDGVENVGEAVGAFAAKYYGQPANLALYFTGSDTPLATATFTSAGTAPYIDPASQLVTIPNIPPGTRAALTVKAWIGSDFATARVKGSWNFLSLPLGGGLASGQNFAVPGLYGWGDEMSTSEVFALKPGPRPTAATDEIVRPYRQDTTISIDTLLANDTDPDGGTLTFVAADPASNGGAVISTSGSTITYKRNAEADDYFFYTIRSSHGVIGKGRVNVKAGDPIGEIIFSNYNIPKASVAGTYNVPIFVDYNTNGVFNTGEDIASFAALFGKTATLGLYQQGSSQPIATLKLEKVGGSLPIVTPPVKLTNITFTTAPGSGFSGGMTYTASLDAEGKFRTTTSEGQAVSTGTYDYVLNSANNTARLRLNYVTWPGDFDDVTLIFPSSGANSFSGTQAVSGTVYPFTGTFTYSGASNPQSMTAGTLVPGYRPGDQAALTVKVWVGEDFDSATVKKSWDFTSLPLGGPLANSTTVPAPGLTGWGTEDGHGYAVDGAGPLPVAGPDHLQITVGRVIPVSVLLTNDFDPAGGGVTVILFDLTSQNGNPILLANEGIFLSTATSGTDAFNYSVISSGGVVSAGHVDVTLTPPGGVGGGGSSARIYFSNRLVRHSAGSGAYNIPIWVDKNFNGRRDPGEGIGSFASQLGQDATLGLFLRNGATPLATARFYSDNRGAFLEDPEFQTVSIPGATSGSPAQLTLKAWVGPAFDSAAIKASWDLNSLPLGGAAGNTLDIPDLSGWGEGTSSPGYGIVPGVKPKTYGQVLTRAPGQNMSTKISDMIKNDSDPENGALSFVSVEESSREGAVVTLLGDTVYYIAPVQDTGAPDYFEYTIRNSKGGIAKGRVDVVVMDANGQFNTRLSVENLPDGNQISFRGIIGANYLIQYSDGVGSKWQTLGAAVDEGFGLFKITDTNADDFRLYRVLTQ